MSAQKRKQLTDARIAKGLSRPDLAKLVGVSFEHIKRLEYGMVNPSTPLMFKICRVLDSTPDELFKDIVCA
ncbi:helix-turn-helix transcriptional regulator [Paenibacillus sp.]|uniref:helix-turn-helix transcriptional regulator n=1 Tax=Paenibacillus sp. TaxID=58172 RepID=UPI00281BA5C2|nr:helix-turn-helix transcriptional regulator [Paenibacillus sp.]MDR0269592.1 helix-turn-helix domain-containing protein [Paenibacillus sp.]